MAERLQAKVRERGIGLRHGMYSTPALSVSHRHSADAVAVYDLWRCITVVHLALLLKLGDLASKIYQGCIGNGVFYGDSQDNGIVLGL